MTKTRVVIQSRLNSTRLPGKAMLTMAGMPLIELVARRASRSGHEVIVATSEEPYDRWIAEHMRSVGIPTLQGPLDDVLGRFELACRGLADDDWVIRLTGDNPLADADLVDELLAAMSSTRYRYGRVDIDRVPEGIGCEAFRAVDLRRAAAQATESYDREHVTPWLRRNLGELLWAPEGSPDDIHAYRATVDCLADYDRVMQLFAGVDDPVAIGYRELFERLSVLLQAQGRMARRTRAAGWELAELILDADALAGEPADRVREVFAASISRGVAQVHVTHAVGEEVIHIGSDPQLRNRFQTIVQLPGQGRADLELAGSRANLGLRSVTAAYLAQLPDEEQWWQLQDAQIAGHVQRLGVRVSDPADLDEAVALPGLSFIVAEGFHVASTDRVAIISAGLGQTRPGIAGIRSLDDLSEALAD